MEHGIRDGALVTLGTKWSPIEEIHPMFVLIGQYQKRMQMKRRDHHGLVFGHEVHDQSRQEQNSN
jgi:hypothetical protein